MNYYPNHRRNFGRPIFKLNDDSLLRVFHLVRQVCLGWDCLEDYISEGISGGGGWARERRWWRPLVLVCRKWRHLIFGSSFHLRLCIVYTIGKPVADMLAHPPFRRLPLVIEYIHTGVGGISTYDANEITWALQHRDRVRRIRLHVPHPKAVIGALNGEFPVLECLYLKIQNGSPSDWGDVRTFRAPCLRQLVLDNIIWPLTPPLLTPVAGLVTLSLTEIHGPDKSSPNDLLFKLSLMPRLETLRIGFPLFSPRNAGELILKRVELLRLRRFMFNGTSNHLEALLPYISTPRLDKLQIYISNRDFTSLPNILQFMSKSENLRCHSTELMFLEHGVFMRATLTDGTGWTAFSISFNGDSFIRQVQVAEYFLKLHGRCFLMTTFLTIHCRTSSTRQPYHEPDRELWRKLFEVFWRVQGLYVYDGPHGEISRSFQIRQGESLMFPNLKQLSIHTSLKYRNENISQFIDARKFLGRPVDVVYIGKALLAAEVAFMCESWEAPWLMGSFRVRYKK